MWHELKTSVNFKFSPIVWCSVLEKKLLCFPVLWDEEKCVQSCILAAQECRVEVSGKRNHFSLWHWELRGVSNWSRLDFHLRETGKIDVSQLPEASSVSAWHFSQFSMHDWKHFPHTLSGVFSQAQNIKSSTKTWNQLKFSTHVISMVYCSMSYASFAS